MANYNHPNTLSKELDEKLRNPKTLYTWYWEKQQSPEEIADAFGVKRGNIRRRLRDENIPTRRSNSNYTETTYPKDVVREWWVEQELSVQETATLANITRTWVRSLVYHYDLDEYRDPEMPWLDVERVEQMVDDGCTDQVIAEVLGTNKWVVKSAIMKYDIRTNNTESFENATITRSKLSELWEEHGDASVIADIFDVEPKYINKRLDVWSIRDRSTSMTENAKALDPTIGGGIDDDAYASVHGAKRDDSLGFYRAGGGGW